MYSKIKDHAFDSRIIYASFDEAVKMELQPISAILFVAHQQFF